ncbi:DNA-binding response regulator [Candidatus Dojkabacteria bacterium CG_4_10_14_3_um_filter_Dojkabacteria_WS6_41_9]|uniref:DNA-binding response regulator n=1 Tax=Candidatus Dojkabacteria bacterium CG_4_10_14_0_2_um_filter_Dojkabacteria_WS6_41_15 TaxID=2014249 RepID=A0A2M7W0I1_9BACT|nr:MAG: DNA-binding response regulator [Candidatus Dojkabacteria bacterium CG_4_10_14_3_um_filter_Dojkabacteria_WS6_41_9]PJA11831.1 MAG: DNA-binding response regulator [Candidatus Dojkabacteria bacterium CG_4_10_14_0_2_um_filter_Dojkabacteria_WS6_41_15]
MTMRLLLIEDEEGITIPLKAGLERRNYAVDVSDNGANGLRMALINQYDCILLDLNLPELDGLEVARRLREKENKTPILMLTARDLRKDIWAGFESGADDYLTKPFDFVELVYRVQALIKRNSLQSSPVLEAANIVVDTAAIRVCRDGIAIPLNKKEYGVLEYLLRNRGRMVSSEELLEHVWDKDIDSFSQTVRTNIKTLRKKVDPNKEIIKTIKGYGYIID